MVGSTLTAAAVVILLGGVKLASGILSPIIFAVFVAILLLPIIRWLERKGLPTWAALLLLTVGVLALVMVLTLFLLLSLGQVRDHLPAYQARLAALGTQIKVWLDRLHVDATTLQKLMDPPTVISALTSVLSQTTNGLILAFLILLGIGFTMLESTRFEDKLRYAFGGDHPMVAVFTQFSTQVQRFFSIRALNNLIVAAGSAVFLVVMRIDFALLWAVLIFFLSYVPSIGIIIACVPAVALALIQYGVVTGLVVVAGLTLINYISDYILTPRMMSQGLGLSAFTTLLSFFVWAYLLGAVGALLSVPLTLLVKLLLEASPDTRGLAALMSDQVPGTRDTNRSAG